VLELCDGRPKMGLFLHFEKINGACNCAHKSLDVVNYATIFLGAHIIAIADEYRIVDNKIN
jgi:hypothetical protein